MKKTIFAFILGMLVSGTVAFAANYLYQADEVSFTSDNSDWDVDNVDDALRDLYARVSDSNGALTSLKNTAIAKAVGANGNDFTSVINVLSNITNQGNKSFTVNGTSAITIPAGYYNGQGTISTSGLIPTPSATLTLSDVTNGTDVTNYKTVKTSGLMKTPTATKSITANGSNIDVTNYGKVNVSVPNSNSGTYQTVTSNGTHDMGATNSYRYVKVSVNNTLNAEHLGWNKNSTRQVSASVGDIIVVLNAAYNGPTNIIGSGATLLGYYNFSNGNDSPIFILRATATTVNLVNMATGGGTDLWRIYRS